MHLSDAGIGQHVVIEVSANGKKCQTNETVPQNPGESVEWILNSPCSMQVEKIDLPKTINVTFYVSHGETDHEDEQDDLFIAFVEVTLQDEILKYIEASYYTSCVGCDKCGNSVTATLERRGMHTLHLSQFQM